MVSKITKARGHKMKFNACALLLLGLLPLAGCASSGSVRHASAITAPKPFDLDLILVQASSSMGDLAAEQQMLTDAIVSDLRDTHMFKAVSANREEIGSGSGIILRAEIQKIKKISKEKRLWEGAVAGRACIWLQVTVSDLNSGNQIETFEAYGESSGGSALAGTTDEAIERVANLLIGEVLKINSQTAE